MVHLPWLETRIVREVSCNPTLRFKNLLKLFCDEYDPTDVSDAVCHLVNRGIIRLGQLGFEPVQ